MMANTLTQYQNEQYVHFRTNLTSTWSIDESKVDSWASSLKPLHKKYLSLSCTATIMGHRARRAEYIYSIAEVSYLSMILFLKGLSNPAYVLLRQSIELALKHVYFLSHPVEYGWARTRVDYKDLSFQYLFEYLKRTDEYKALIKLGGLDVNQRINDLYHILSRYVHVHSQDFMGYRAVAPATGSQALKELNNVTKELWPLLVILVIAFSHRKFCEASALEQKLIRAGLPKAYRNALNAYLRDK
jgi:hypothetical protein